MEAAQAALRERLADQARACAALDSSLYALLLARAAEDLAAGGPTRTVLAPLAHEDPGAAIALRLMAAVHRLVLSGRAPALAPHYPSVGGDAGVDGAWPAFRALLAERPDEVRHLVRRPCQTNDVGRCTALLGGFLTVARSTGLPLRLLEVGASAGLNLRWDRYRYDSGATTWGEPASPVRVTGRWDLPAVLLATDVTVGERRGCDLNPVDVATPEGRLGLTASVWADQTWRLERLEAAIRLAGAVPPTVERSSAASWLPERLADPAPGAATVVFHSVVLQYLGAEERAAVVATLAGAGRRATPEAPLAWLRMEPEGPLRAMAVRLTTWPGGEERLLATAGAHGDPLRWRA